MLEYCGDCLNKGNYCLLKECFRIKQAARGVVCEGQLSGCSRSRIPPNIHCGIPRKEQLLSPRFWFSLQSPVDSSSRTDGLVERC